MTGVPLLEAAGYLAWAFHTLHSPESPFRHLTPPPLPSGPMIIDLRTRSHVEYEVRLEGRRFRCRRHDGSPHWEVGEVYDKGGHGMAGMKEELGRVESARLGLDSGRFGVHFQFTLGGGTEGVGHFLALKEAGMDVLAGHLRDAKTDYLDQMVGKPVMVTLQGDIMTGFRVLTEVL